MVRPLGRGGMAAVYEARSIVDGRSVALKVQTDLGQPELEAQLNDRFKREVRILQNLQHENLPAFYGWGLTDEGRLYISMELLVGRPLTDFTGSSLEVLLPLLVQCALALRVVAEAGIVHRDVSPDNFFVVEVGGRSVVKLIDFGVARDLAAVAEQLTQSNVFLGKADFCSPEQTRMLPGLPPVTWRSDLYSFGLTVLYLVNGALPFDGQSQMEHLQARLAEIPRARFEAIRPARLGRILRRMLAVHPEDRPPNFDEVLAELLRTQAEMVSNRADALSDTSRRKTRGARDEASRSRIRTGGAAGEGAGGSRPETDGSATRESLSARAARLFSRTRLLAAGFLPSRRNPRSMGDETEAISTGFRHVFLVSGDGQTREERFGRGAERPLPDRILVGRAPGPDSPSIRVNAQTVSSLHARLVRQGNRYAVEGLSRTNETFVNGSPLKPGRSGLVADGDRIDVGEVSLTFRCSGADQGSRR